MTLTNVINTKKSLRSEAVLVKNVKKIQFDSLLVADNAEIGILSPTSKERSEPVGKITDLFFLDFGIFDSSL